MFKYSEILLTSILLTFMVPPCTIGASEPAEELITVPIQGGSLAGTLLQPVTAKDGSKPPVALIIAGSGPTDRNGNGPLGGADNLRQLAHGLQRCGIASLRFDKRGIGQSRFPSLAEHELRISDFVDDVKQLALFLTDQSRFGDLWLIGHSEGALIALAAQSDVEAQRLVLLAGSSQRYLDIISRQFNDRLTKSDRLRLDKSIKQIRAGLLHEVKIHGQLGAVLRPGTLPFLATADVLDPLLLAAQINVPVTVIQGDTDLQVQVEDAYALAAAAKAPTQVIISGMNHMLKAQGGDKYAQSISYANPGIPLHPQVLAALCPDGISPPPVIYPSQLSASDRELVGVWGGTIKGLNLRIIFRLFDTGKQLGGVADSPDQNAAGLILSSVNKKGRRVTLLNDQVGVKFVGQLKKTNGGQFINGKFRQGGQSFELILKKLRPARLLPK